MTYDGRTKYDRGVAATYDADREKEEHWAAENEFVRRYAAENRLGTVLDVPVGTGRLLPMLSGAERIVGLDVSDDMLREARKVVDSKGLRNVELRQGDALATGFATKEFDTVTCFRLAHLLPPDLVGPLIAELTRVARGVVLLQGYIRPDDVPASGPARFAGIPRALRARLRPRKPWSHITSYVHGFELFESAAGAAGRGVARRHTLGNYEGASVEVLELR